MGQNKANPTLSNWIMSGLSSKSGFCQDKKIILVNSDNILTIWEFLEAILWTIEIMFMALQTSKN